MIKKFFFFVWLVWRVCVVALFPYRLYTTGAFPPDVVLLVVYHVLSVMFYYGEYKCFFVKYRYLLGILLVVVGGVVLMGLRLHLFKEAQEAFNIKAQKEEKNCTLECAPSFGDNDEMGKQGNSE
jgi:hypothetical protein